MSGEQRIPLADHVADAVALLGSVRRTEVIPLDGRALGRIAVAEQRARVDVPGHDNSQMDGFALAAADLAAAGESVTLHLGPMIAMRRRPRRPRARHRPPDHDRGADPRRRGAGDPGRGERRGPVPPSDAEESPVTLVPTSVAPGRFVRTRGSDTRRGDTVLREDRLLTPPRIAHLASCGIRDVRVLAPVRALVLSTGSEVRSAGDGAPDPGALFDANGLGLTAAAAEAGC